MLSSKSNKETITLPISAIFHADGTVEYEYRTFYVKDVARHWGLIPD